MDAFLNFPNINKTVKYTDEQLLKILQHMKDAIKVRLYRRMCVKQSAIVSALTYCIQKDPSFPKELREPRLSYYTFENAITFSFIHGESVFGKKYDYEDPEEHIPLFRCNIKRKAKDIIVRIEPTKECIYSLPLDRENIRNFQSKVLTYSVSRKTNNSKTICYKMVSGPNSTDRKNIYGEFIARFIKYFFTEQKVFELFEIADNISKSYNKYNIGKAKAATMEFLLIGRFRLPLVYDVVKLIGKYVWDSRYDNSVWAVNDELSELPPLIEENLPYVNPLGCRVLEDDYYAEPGSIGDEIRHLRGLEWFDKL